MINNKKSREIYRDLINGNIINQYRYDEISDTLKENDYFTELAGNYEGDNGYRTLYERIGYELIMRPNYAYLRDLTQREDENSQTAVAIHAVLTLLGKITIQNNYHFSLLTTPEAGISQTLCEQADQDETMQNILLACYCSKPLWEEAERLLVKRNIAFINARQNLVLSNAGIDFFQEIFTHENKESEQK